MCTTLKLKFKVSSKLGSLKRAEHSYKMCTPYTSITNYYNAVYMENIEYLKRNRSRKIIISEMRNDGYIKG